MVENSLEKKSIVREQEYSVRKKIDKTKRTIAKLSLYSNHLEVELFKTYALSYRQMVLRVSEYEKLHHIIVNLLDTMAVPYIFNISLAQSVRTKQSKKIDSYCSFCVYLRNVKMKY